MLCVLIFAMYVPVWFDKHFISYAISTSGYIFHGSLMIVNKLKHMMSALTSNLTMQDQHRRYNVLKNYFTAGFSYKEICNFLFRFHRIKITIRHLNRLLMQCSLQRRWNHSNINTVIKLMMN